MAALEISSSDGFLALSLSLSPGLLSSSLFFSASLLKQMTHARFNIHVAFLAYFSGSPVGFVTSPTASLTAEL